MKRIARVAVAVLMVIFGSAPHASAECLWAGEKFDEKSVKRQDDHFLHACTNDHWELQSPSQIKILSAWYGVDIHSCEIKGFVAGRCDGQSSCGLIAKDENLSNPHCNTVLHQRLLVGHVCTNQAGVEIPGSQETVTIYQPDAGLISCGASD